MDIDSDDESRRRTRDQGFWYFTVHGICIKFLNLGIVQKHGQDLVENTELTSMQQGFCSFMVMVQSY